MTSASGSKDPRDRIALVVIPSGALGEQLLGVVAKWTTEGVLAEAIWVRPEDVSVVDGRAPHITGARPSHDGWEQVELFEFVGRRQRTLVRLILAQVVTDRAHVDDLQLEAGLFMREWLKDSLPGALTGGTGSPGTDLRSVNLITSVTGVSDMPDRLASTGWDVIAVTSPEDRPDPARANQFVRADANLLPLTALSVACVAGLFVGVRSTPFDDIDGDSSVVFGKPLIVRPTVRAVMGEVTIRGTAASATKAALKAGSPADADPERFVEARQPERLVESMLSWLGTADAAALARSPQGEDESTATEAVSIRSGLSTFVWFVGRAMVVMAWSLWRLVLRGTEEVMTRAIVGERSGIRLTLQPDVGADLADDLIALEADDIALREQEVSDIQQRVVRMPTDQLWGELRSVTHGMLDGGPLPQGAPRSRDGSRIILLADQHFVVPRPDDWFDVPEGAIGGLGAVRARACVPSDALALSHHLSGAVGGARSLLAEAQAVLASDNLKLADDGAEESQDAVRRAKKRVARGERELKRLVALEEQFREWLARRRSTLMWRLSEIVTQRRVEAEKDEAVAEEQVTKPADINKSRPGALQRTFLIRAWITLAIAVLILVSMAADVLSPSAHENWSAFVVVVVITTALLVLFARAWYRGLLEFLLAYKRGAERRAAAAALFELANSDRRRLEEAERQLRDWSGILGWSLHTPWAHAGASEVDDAADEDPLRPAAFVVAEPVLEAHNKSEIELRTRRLLTTVGWRTRAYRRLVSGHLGEPGTVDDDSLDLAIERFDRGDGRAARDRRDLLQSLESGLPQERAVAEVIGEAEQILREKRLFLPRLPVRPMGAAPGHDSVRDEATFLQEALVPASPLARETWSASALVEGEHENLAAHVWSLHTTSGQLADQEVRGVMSEEDIRDSALLDLVVRLDVSGWLDLKELRLFAPAPADEPVRPQPPDDRDESVFI